MTIWVLNFIYSGVQDRVIIGCSNWNAIFVSQMVDNACKLRAFTISGQSHFHIKVFIVKYTRSVVLIIRLRDFIIIVDAFKFFAKIAIDINKVYPMVVVGFIPDIFILTADYLFFLHGLTKRLKHIFYLSICLLSVGDSLNGWTFDHCAPLG